MHTQQQLEASKVTRKRVRSQSPVLRFVEQHLDSCLGNLTVCSFCCSFLQPPACRVAHQALMCFSLCFLWWS